MTFDESVAKCSPAVASAIMAIADRAGTTDADWQVFLAAGSMLAEMSGQLSGLSGDEQPRTEIEVG